MFLHTKLRLQTLKKEEALESHMQLATGMRTEPMQSVQAAMQQHRGGP